MLELLKRFVTEEMGQGMAEYGLILALIACVVVAAVTNIGTSLKTKFNEVVVDLGGTAAP